MQGVACYIRSLSAAEAPMDLQRAFSLRPAPFGFAQGPSPRSLSEAEAPMDHAKSFLASIHALRLRSGTIFPVAERSRSVLLCVIHLMHGPSATLRDRVGPRFRLSAPPW